MLLDLKTKLVEKKLTLSCAESFTGGMFAQTITSVPNSSAFFLGGIVSYAKAIKENLLQIPKRIINDYGVVSKEVALLMATNAKKLFQSDIAVSFTGNAGPGCLEDKPVGLIYIGIITPDKTIVEKIQFASNLNRTQIRSAAIEWVINFLNKNL